MKFVMLTYVGPDHKAWWDAVGRAERQAEVDRVMAWFGEHGAAGRIVGGEELGYAHQARTVRRRGVTDGPFIETKELLGGFIVLEAPDMTAALEIAGGWPGLAWDDDAVEVRPAGDTVAEVAATPETATGAG